MRAVVYTQYGPPEVLHLREVARPTPKDNEVLIRVHASTVTSGDWRLRKAEPVLIRGFAGLLRPKHQTLGNEVAGDVEAVGSLVTRFKPGDAIFGTGMFGAYAEYHALPEDGMLMLKPPNLSYEQAAALPNGAFTALHFLRLGGVKAGQRVLVYGASGSVGTYAVQLAKHFGAEVAAVCGTRNVDLVRSLGADRVIDYTREDFTRDGVRYDIIFDTVGKTSFSRCRRSLTPQGRYVLSAFGPFEMAQMLWTSLRGGQ
ncbi:MAG: NAD(P)-dependent alcohol dehydrogenase, partial [Chloroflexota bacterium]